MSKILVLYFVATIWFIPVFSQKVKSTAEVIEARKQSIHKNSEDFYIASSLSGKKYDIVYRGAINSQFYSVDPTQLGTLTYDGILYKNIQVRYDLFSQQIVILLKSQNNAHHVSIDNKKVSKFSIGISDFIHVREDSVMEDGIYQLTYRGNQSDIFVKRIKTKRQVSNSIQLQLKFSQLTEYYIKNEYGTFHITNKKGLLKAYNNSEELISILKKHKIKLSKKGIENGLIEAISLLDSNLTAIVRP